jgi:hypothetical protein
MKFRTYVEPLERVATEAIQVLTGGPGAAQSSRPRELPVPRSADS